MLAKSIKSIGTLSPAITFLIVSFSLGELGDGLNIFQVRQQLLVTVVLSGGCWYRNKFLL